MEFPVYLRWAIVGMGLIVIGCLNLSIGRKAAGSPVALLFRLAWLIMVCLILIGAVVTVHSLFFLER
jgi:hypothetical protein